MVFMGERKDNNIPLPMLYLGVRVHVVDNTGRIATLSILNPLQHINLLEELHRRRDFWFSSLIYFLGKEKNLPIKIDNIRNTYMKSVYEFHTDDIVDILSVSPYELDRDTAKEIIGEFDLSFPYLLMSDFIQLYDEDIRLNKKERRNPYGPVLLEEPERNINLLDLDILSGTIMTDKTPEDILIRCNYNQKFRNMYSWVEDYQMI